MCTFLKKKSNEMYNFKIPIKAEKNLKNDASK